MKDYLKTIVYLVAFIVLVAIAFVGFNFIVYGTMPVWLQLERNAVENSRQYIVGAEKELSTYRNDFDEQQRLINQNPKSDMVKLYKETQRADLLKMRNVFDRFGGISKAPRELDAYVDFYFDKAPEFGL